MNVEFFKLYDGMMEALREKGILARRMLKVYNKKVNWPEKNSAEERKYFRYVVARYQGFANVVWDFAEESYNEKIMNCSVVIGIRARAGCVPAADDGA